MAKQEPYKKSFSYTTHKIALRLLIKHVVCTPQQREVSQTKLPKRIPQAHTFLTWFLTPIYSLQWEEDVADRWRGAYGNNSGWGLKNMNKFKFFVVVGRLMILGRSTDENAPPWNNAPMGKKAITAKALIASVDWWTYVGRRMTVGRSTDEDWLVDGWKIGLRVSPVLTFFWCRSTDEDLSVDGWRLVGRRMSISWSTDTSLFRSVDVDQLSARSIDYLLDSII